MHDMRHTAARAALNTGEVPIEQVSQAFGHSRLDTTHRIYGGNIPRYNEAFVAGLSGVLPPASQQNTHSATRSLEIRNGE